MHMGDFRWQGKLYTGSHQALVSRDRFADVQAVLSGKPCIRYPKQKHAFMGLIHCGRCGCLMTAEKKKGKYVYYRCTSSRGKCGNTYIRQEQLSNLLGTVIAPIQITTEIADGIATALTADDAKCGELRAATLRQLDGRRRAVTTKLDRGYDDYVSGKISEEFWTRKSQEWEAEAQAINTEAARLERPQTPTTATAAKILELAKQAVFLYKSQDPTEQRRLLETVLSNCTFDRGSLSPTYTKPSTSSWQRNR